MVRKINKPDKKAYLLPLFQRKPGKYAAFIVAIALAAVSAVLLLSFSGFIESHLFNEQSICSNENAQNDAHITDSVIKALCEQTAVLGKIRTDYASDIPANTINVPDKLNGYVLFDGAVLMAETPDGYYYSSDGGNGLWERIFHKFNELAGKGIFDAGLPLSCIDWFLAILVNSSLPSFDMNDAIIMIIVLAGIILTLVVISVMLAVFLLTDYAGARKIKRTQAEFKRSLAEEFRRASEQKEDYYSQVAHDIRTPISGIIGMADIAEQNAENPEKVHYCLGKIRSCSEYLLSLVNDMLDMRKIEKGEMKIQPKPMNILELLDDCASIIRGQLSGRYMEFRCNFSGIEHERVRGNSLRLRQVLINILSNAVKFTPDGGRIEFTASEGRGESGTRIYCFTVTDNGIGMSEEFQKRMFLPFTQEHESGSSSFAGTGLGMAIAKQLVELMKGEIAVNSAPGKGTEISVSLELCEQPEITQNEINGSGSLTGMRVLVAEDSLLNMEILRFNLEKAGIRVIPAKNGQEAAELFAQSAIGSIEAIIMDVRMPVMNGLDSTRLIRSMDRPDSARVKIIALTANSHFEDIQQTLSAGMDECITKPIDTGELMKHLYKIHACNPEELSRV